MSAMKPYIVRQGEYLTKIAFEQGFDAKRVWNDAKNAELRSGRKDPEMLAPGDIVYVPDRPSIAGVAEVQGRSAFVTSIPRIEIALELRVDGEPMTGRAFLVVAAEGDQVLHEGVTEADGRVRFDVSVQTREVRLLVAGRVEVLVEVGAMDPAEETSGVSARLMNLGYLHEPSTPSSRAYREALAMFAASRCDPGADSETVLEALQRAHGV